MTSTHCDSCRPARARRVSEGSEAPQRGIPDTYQRSPRQTRETRRLSRSMLKTKSIWSPIDRKSDGLRILATRFRGRGLETTRYDVWMASLGPSERLLKSVQSGRISWSQFARQYRA